MSPNTEKFLRSSEGFRQWVKVCGFTSSEAARTLRLPARTYWRWRVNGLPDEAAGYHAAFVMWSILKQKRRRIVIGKL